MSAKCKSCGAAIEFAIMASSGRPHPFNALVDDRQGTLFSAKLTEPPSIKGKFVILAGTARPATEEDVRLLRFLRESHFSSCPDAKRWRGGLHGDGS